jgi:3-oxoacyl-[acyl-carrier-protein] synthase-1
MKPHHAALRPVGIGAQGLVSAAGVGLAPLALALRGQCTALAPNTWSRVPLQTWLGRVADLEVLPLPPVWAEWDCRATRLAWQGLQADGFIDAVQRRRERHGACRIGLVLGTSASTIAASELAYRSLDADGRFPAALRSERLNTPHALARFVQLALDLGGPCCTVSTACSSSAKAFAQAERWLRLDLVDAVVVGGVDALCESVLFGFHALQLTAAGACRPFDAGRAGISVGEAAGFALLERGPAALELRGWGESNDAHHMSSPHPQGLGAELALEAALQRAGVDAGAIGYLNLHGTASARNDEVEAALVARRYGRQVHASATKGLTGHTMGAAGIVEAAICLLALSDGLRSGSVGTQSVDPALGATFTGQLQLNPAQGPVELASSHSFGFGGNNCVLVFGRGN